MLHLSLDNLVCFDFVGQICWPNWEEWNIFSPVDKFLLTNLGINMIRKAQQNTIPYFGIELLCIFPELLDLPSLASHLSPVSDARFHFFLSILFIYLSHT